MHEFRVWAPHAGHVDLEWNGRSLPMEVSERQDWWRLRVEGAGPGDDYGFRLDGGPPLPDPRSPWQPQGVDGLSRLVDHGSFSWTDHGWRPPPLASGVIYELHLGTFSPEGTADGAIPLLPHLKELGVTHVELMPVHQFSGEHGWGYDGVDLYAPHGAYGGPDGLKRLVNACHDLDLAVILDVVYNHLGPHGNVLARFGPYFTDGYHTPWGPAVNLDGPGSMEVRRFFLDNAKMWFSDYHMDGLRIDAVHAFHDRSAIHFLEQMAEETRALEAGLGRSLTLIAESDLNDPRVVTSREAGGFGLTAQWSDDFHHAVHAVLTGERDGYYMDFGRLGDVARALERTFVYDGRYSPFREKHHGKPITSQTAERFLGYIQNHDQVGNRADGTRLTHLTSRAKLKAAAALYLTAPFIPMIFQGEEWGASSPFLYFTDHRDPDLAEKVRQGRRQEFAGPKTGSSWTERVVPDPQDPKTFERSKLDWEEKDREAHREILDWYRALIRLRKDHAELWSGSAAPLRVVYDESQKWLSMARGHIAVVLNFADKPRRVSLGGLAAPKPLLGSGHAMELHLTGSGGWLELASGGAAVLAESSTPVGQ